MTPVRMPTRPPRLTPREALLFEAGIKLGGIFHQYLGTPVSAKTAGGLAAAIAGAVSLQPFVHRVTVGIDVARGGPTGKGRYAYRYLTPEMLSVRVHLRDGPTRVVVGMSYRADLRYPLMHVVSASSAPRSRRTAAPRRRPA
jgi:hypothetical protein